MRLIFRARRSQFPRTLTLLRSEFRCGQHDPNAGNIQGGCSSQNGRKSVERQVIAAGWDLSVDPDKRRTAGAVRLISTALRFVYNLRWEPVFFKCDGG